MADIVADSCQSDQRFWMKAIISPAGIRSGIGAQRPSGKGTVEHHINRMKTVKREMFLVACKRRAMTAVTDLHE